MPIRKQAKATITISRTLFHRDDFEQRFRAAAAAIAGAPRTTVTAGLVRVLDESIWCDGWVGIDASYDLEISSLSIPTRRISETGSMMD